MTLYLDLYFLVNYIADMFVLMCTSRLCGLSAGFKRCALGALVGGTYGALSVIFPQLGMITLEIFVAACMVCVVFGIQRKTLRAGVVFYLISSCVAGGAYKMTLVFGGSRVDIKLLLLILAILYWVSEFVLGSIGRDSSGGGTGKVAVSYKDKTVEFTALADTGNTLRDPMGGGAVLVTEYSQAKALLPRDAAQYITRAAAEDPIAFLAGQGGKCGIKYRLIPYSAVGTKGGVLLAFKPDSMYFRGKRVNEGVIALAPDPVSGGGGYTALMGE